MLGKITLEEHFALTETLGPGSDDLHRRLRDFGGSRISEMDEFGIQFSVLSLNAPAVQGILEINAAVEMARRANDFLADEISKRSDRFGGFAALPMQDPDLATEELTRCVKELGFVGANVNSFTQKDEPETHIFYDIPKYRSFWASVQELDVPFYLHPRNPVTERIPQFDGHPWLTYSAWAFAFDAALHALRLMCSGLFDDYPNLQLILGHLGERIPFDLWRVDHRIEEDPKKIPAQKSLREYMRTNVHVTTSGQFYDPPLHLTLNELGIDRVMFSVDYPFESMEKGCNWFDNAKLTKEEQIAIGRTNAIKLLKLNLD